MSAINDNNFVTIQGWMRTKLGLKGNELLAYAVIYGFSQTDGAKFTGSRKYLAEWCGCAMATIDRTLNSLVDKGLISRTSYVTKHGYRAVEYAAMEPTHVDEPSAAEPRTTDTDTPHTPADEPQPLLTEPEPKPQPKKTRKSKSFDDIIDAYTSDPTTKKLLGEWLQNRKAKRSAMTDSAIQSNIDVLDRLAQESRMNVNDYLSEVIRRGWGSFFAINNYRSTGTPQQKPQQQNPWYDTPEAQRQYENDIKEWEEHCVFRL